VRALNCHFQRSLCLKLRVREEEKSCKKIKWYFTDPDYQFITENDKSAFDKKYTKICFGHATVRSDRNLIEFDCGENVITC
jgi:hypothetical protein